MQELVAAILANPDDERAWLVYGDWLQSQGDPRGELLAVQHSMEKGRTPALEEREKKLLEQHADKLLGPLKRWQKTLDGKGDDAFTWKRGFLRSVRISYNDYALDEAARKDIDIVAITREIFAHPSAAFVEEVVIGEVNSGKWSDPHNSSQLYFPVVAEIVAAKPPLRKLVVGEYEFPDETEISWTYIGDISPIWKAFPRLESLRVQGGNIELGSVDAPSLKEATFATGGLPEAAVRSIANAQWPRLERLEIWFGDEMYGAGSTLADIRPILEGTSLPALKHLGLRNCMWTDEIAGVIGKSPIVKRLRSLDLSMGTLSDEGVSSLVQDGASLRHLEALDVSQSYLTEDAIRSLAGVVRTVESGDQRDPDDERYVAVGE